MPLERILEPEVMDSPEEATDYDTMDHAEVNRVFVEDLVEVIKSSKFKVQGPKSDEQESTLNFELGTVNLDILDLGTGTALIPIELCRRLADCRVMAADAAVSMLELARYNIEVNSLRERIELARVDAKRLPFGDAMFDVVMSNSIVHHIPEPIHVLREALRVTRPGGILFFRDLLRPESEERLQHLVATYTAGANANQHRLFAESLHAALSLSEIRNLITSLGFAADSVQATSDRHWTWIARCSEKQTHDV
jgi:ubiquinone/menaquinone biosynthesis C-methylase UbiE